jgi:hypothetical protein
MNRREFLTSLAAVVGGSVLPRGEEVEVDSDEMMLGQMPQQHITGVEPEQDDTWATHPQEWTADVTDLEWRRQYHGLWPPMLIRNNSGEVWASYDNSETWILIPPTSNLSRWYDSLWW